LRCRDVGKGWMDGNVGSTSSQRIYVWSTNLPFSPGKNSVAMTRWGGSIKVPVQKNELVKETEMYNSSKLD